MAQIFIEAEKHFLVQITNISPANIGCIGRHYPKLPLVKTFVNSLSNGLILLWYLLKLVKDQGSQNQCFMDIVKVIASISISCDIDAW